MRRLIPVLIVLTNLIAQTWAQTDTEPTIDESEAYSMPIYFNYNPDDVWLSFEGSDEYIDIIANRLIRFTDFDGNIQATVRDGAVIAEDSLGLNDIYISAWGTWGADSAWIVLNGITYKLFTDQGTGAGGVTNEEIEDVVGGMVVGNTESLITVVYDDTDGELDFTVEDNLALYNNTTSNFATETYVDDQQRTDSEVKDLTGLMVSGNTETLISVQYMSGDNTLDFIVEDDLQYYDNTNTKFQTDDDVALMIGDTLEKYDTEGSGIIDQAEGLYRNTATYIDTDDTSLIAVAHHLYLKSQDDEARIYPDYQSAATTYYRFTENYVIKYEYDVSADTIAMISNVAQSDGSTGRVQKSNGVGGFSSGDWYMTTGVLYMLESGNPNLSSQGYGFTGDYNTKFFRLGPDSLGIMAGDSIPLIIANSGIYVNDTLLQTYVETHSSGGGSVADSLGADSVTITDAGNYYDSTTVEGMGQEIGAVINEKADTGNYNQYSLGYYSAPGKISSASNMFWITEYLNPHLWISAYDDSGWKRSIYTIKEDQYNNDTTTNLVIINSDGHTAQSGGLSYGIGMDISLRDVRDSENMLKQYGGYFNLRPYGSSDSALSIEHSSGNAIISPIKASLSGEFNDNTTGTATHSIAALIVSDNTTGTANSYAAIFGGDVNVTGDVIANGLIIEDDTFSLGGVYFGADDFGADQMNYNLKFKTSLTANDTIDLFYNENYFTSPLLLSANTNLVLNMDSLSNLNNHCTFSFTAYNEGNNYTISTITANDASSVHWATDDSMLTTAYLVNRFIGSVWYDGQELVTDVKWNDTSTIVPVDVTPPLLSSAEIGTVGNDTLVMTFNESVTIDSVNWRPQINDTVITIANVLNSGTTTPSFILNDTILSTDTVQLTYLGAGNTRDASDNYLIAFTDSSVTNNVVVSGGLSDVVFTELTAGARVHDVNNLVTLGTPPQGGRSTNLIDDNTDDVLFYFEIDNDTIINFIIIGMDSNTSLTTYNNMDSHIWFNGSYWTTKHFGSGEVTSSVTWNTNDLLRYRISGSTGYYEYNRTGSWIEISSGTHTEGSYYLHCAATTTSAIRKVNNVQIKE
jgi:hypothetical protein